MIINKQAHTNIKYTILNSKIERISLYRNTNVVHAGSKLVSVKTKNR